MAVEPVALGHWDTSSPVLYGSARPARLRAATALAVALLVVLATALLAYELIGFRTGLQGRVLPGATVEGVDVGGLPAAEALAAVEAAVAPRLDRPLRLRWDAERSWSTTPAAIGTTSDAQAVVEEVVAASASPSWLRSARIRFLGEDAGLDRDVAVTHSVDGARSWVAAVAAEVDRPVRDAAMDHSTGDLVLVGEQVGLAVMVDPSVAAVVEGLTDGAQEVQLGVAGTQPAVTSAALGQVLVVDQSENRLDYYTGGQLAGTWAVSTGTAGYPTPLGEFTIGAKRHMPTWVNPSPDGWGADLPASIGPGRSNPLGLRALNWHDADGNDTTIRFHGTTAVGSLGRSASHGCVRMANDVVVELFDMVDVGARVVSLP